MSGALSLLLIVLNTPLLAACSGDDTVNPTNPDASTAKASDAPKGDADGARAEGGGHDAAKDGARDGTNPNAGDALAEASPDAPAD